MDAEKERRLKTLADTLHKSGFVSSKSDALAKAKEIIDTEEKISSARQKGKEKEEGFLSRIKHTFHKDKEEMPEPPGSMPELSSGPEEEIDFSKVSDNRPLSEIMGEAGVDIGEASQPNVADEQPLGSESSPVESEASASEDKEEFVQEAEREREYEEKAEVLEKELAAVKAKLQEEKKHPKKEDISNLQAEIREMSQEMEELEEKEKKDSSGAD